MRSTQPASISAWAKVTVIVPYLWLIAFFLVPFLIVLKISLSQTAIAQPPYLPVLDISAG
jgi:putrescine transport system permease protein